MVTGGGRGIGRAIVDRLLERGARVFALDVELLGAPGLFCDMGDTDSVRAACQAILAETEHVDHLVNNVGVGARWNGLFETPIEEWDRVLNVNLRSVFLTAKFLGQAMPPGSAMVNIASTRALMSEPDTEPYSASKGGVVALTHSLAMSLGPRGIRVNCISPGWIHTNPTESLRPEDHAQHAAGRVGTPRDIADAALFLLDDTSGFVTGANLVVDGGMTRKMIYRE